MRNACVVCVICLCVLLSCASGRSKQDESSSSEWATSSSTNSNMGTVTTTKDKEVSSRNIEGSGQFGDNHASSTGGDVGGLAKSMLTFVKETVDPLTKQIVRETLTLTADSNSASNVKNDVQASGGTSLSGKSATAKDLDGSKALESNSVVTDTKAEKENLKDKSSVSADASSGISWIFWVLIGILGLVVIIVYFLWRYAKDKIRRLVSALSILDLKSTDQENVNAILTPADKAHIDANYTKNMA